MLSLRKADERGRSQRSWLDSRHTFSFAEYRDPAHMGFRALRVINEDRVAAGGGFPKHSHHDMEIITYVLEGALRHQDSLGNGSVIGRGEIQMMTAGTGITHSEYNASDNGDVHFLQIWIVPETRRLAPGYQQKPFTLKPGELTLLGAKPGNGGAILINQDVKLYALSLRRGQQLEMPLETGRHGWVQLAEGRLMLNDLAMRAGDGAALTSELSIRFAAREDSQLLLFDLA